MFEYINPGFYITSGIILFATLLIMVLGSGKAQSEGKKQKIPYFPILAIIFAIGVPLYNSMSTKEAIIENTKSFNSGNILKCSTFTTQYLVSKENGWSVFEDGFTKDSVLIRADGCSRVGEKE
jgi:hypothetical protein